MHIGWDLGVRTAARQTVGFGGRYDRIRRDMDPCSGVDCAAQSVPLDMVAWRRSLSAVRNVQCRNV